MSIDVFDDTYGPPPAAATPPRKPLPGSFTPTGYQNGGVTGGANARNARSTVPSYGGGYFSDPLLQGHVGFSQAAIGKLLQPQGINPILGQAIQALTSISNSRGPSVDTSFLREFGDTVRKRQGELNQPGFSASQQDLLRTNVTDPLEAQRSAAKQQVVERMAARGIHPGSGIMEQALLDVDRQFSQARTTAERDLATKEIAQDEARKNQAVDIGSVLAQLGLSTEGLNVQAQTAGRGQALSAAGALGGIGSDLQQEPIQRLLQAYGISSGLAQMPYQANQNALATLNTLNNQQVPQADNNAQLVQLLLSLAGQGEGVYQDSLNQQGGFWNVFGQALPGLLQSFGSLFGGGGTGSGVYDSGGGYLGE